MKHTCASRLSVGFAILFVFFAHAQVAHAQSPVIGAISGSTTQGSVLTISGSSLNAEVRQNWDGFFAQNPKALPGVEPEEFLTVLTLAFMKVRRAASSAPDPSDWKKNQT